MSGKHLISKQQFDLRLTRPEEAHEIQRDISRLSSERLTPAFEALFDRLATPNQLIRLGKIELDVGAVSRRELLSDAFTQKLIGLLEVAIAKASDGSSPPAIVQPLRMGRFELWLYFLENGYLPAHAVLPESPAEWHQQLFDTLALDGSAVQRLRQLLSTRPLALERLIIQYDEAFLQHIVALFTGHRHGDLPAAIKEASAVILQCLQAPAALSQWLTKPDFWQAILRDGAMPEEIQAISAFIAKMLHGSSPPGLAQAIPSTPKAPPSATMLRQIEVRLWRILMDEAIIQGHRADTSKLLARALRHQALRPLQLPLLKALTEKKPQWRSVSEAMQLLPDAVAKIPVPEKDQAMQIKREMDSQTYSAEENVFYIANAGVILLHPFLPRFFSKLELSEGPSFKDEPSRGMAICLLHHLATGELRTPEYQLVLPKFLCGMPLNASLDHAIAISGEAQIESDNLLQAAVEHWGALGSSSPDALREGFLQRAGKLEKRESGWFLQMERNTLDILLDRLPMGWGIGMVKLPWMEEVLRVEWR